MRPEEPRPAQKELLASHISIDSLQRKKTDGGGHRQREKSCSAAVTCGMIRGRPGMLRPAGLWHISAPPSPERKTLIHSLIHPPPPIHGGTSPAANVWSAGGDEVSRIFSDRRDGSAFGVQTRPASSLSMWIIQNHPEPCSGPHSVRMGVEGGLNGSSVKQKAI